jgi:hypothetical protein
VVVVGGLSDAARRASSPVLFCHFLGMAGPDNNPGQVFRALPDLHLHWHWEFLRLWIGFELSSSWADLPCYGLNLNRNILDFMRWPQIDLGAQDLSGYQRPKSLKTICIAGSKVLDEYYNSYLRK